MRQKMKNGSHRYDINRTRPRHGQKYTKDVLLTGSSTSTCFVIQTLLLMIVFRF